MKTSMMHFRFEAVKHLNVLHVEDEEIIRSNFKNTLGCVFNTILSAKDGTEALELFKENDIDIVIVDMFITRMKGVELLREIKNISPFIPCIVTLSDASRNNILDLIALDITHILLKPYDLNTLYNKILKISKNQRMLEVNKDLQTNMSLRFSMC